MAQVVVVIAGRTYRMNCDDGQESHIESLASDIDARMADLKLSFGEIGEQRLVVMGALTIADELSEARARISALEENAFALAAEAGDARQALDARDAFLTEAVDAAASRIEKLARLLTGKF